MRLFNKKKKKNLPTNDLIATMESFKIHSGCKTEREIGINIGINLCLSAARAEVLSKNKDENQE